MNAYELADKLEECLGYFGYNKSAAFMLRDQADRIAELEKCLIVEQEHNMMLEDYSDETDGGVRFVGELPDGHPLKYTAPQTKPLSDEEILQAVARGWCSNKNSHKTMDSDLATAIADEIKKAILERHGIK